MIKVYRDNKWIEADPHNGELIRKYDSAGGFVQDIYDPPKEVSINKIVITSHNKRAITGVGGSLTVVAEVQDPEGNRVPFNGSFAMPVGRVGGMNYRTLMMTFIEGVCSKTARWNDAGEFEITSEMINMHLDESEKLDFDGFNISVAE